MPSKKDYERLDAVKANRLDIKQGLPAKHEGRNGDLQVRRTTKGLVLFAKFYDRWYRVAKLEQMHRDGGKYIGTPEDKTFGKLNVNNQLEFSRGKHSIAMEMGQSPTGDAILKVRDTRSTADADIQCANVRDTRGFKNIEIGSTASATSHLKITNAPAGVGTYNVTLAAESATEGNISMAIKAKGTGAVNFLADSATTTYRFIKSSDLVVWEISADSHKMTLTSAGADFAVWEMPDNVLRIFTGSVADDNDIHISPTQNLYLAGELIYLNKTGSTGGNFGAGTTFGLFDFSEANKLTLKSTSGYDLTLTAQGAADASLTSAGADVNLVAGVNVDIVAATGDIDLHTNKTNGNIDIGSDDDSWLSFTGITALDSCTANFGKTNVGFEQKAVVFNATDTYVYFNLYSNKQHLTLTNNVTDVHFKFPESSGNFVCVLLQDGTGGRTISNFKALVPSGATPTIKWAGGTEPSNTETADKADIVSIYYDDTNEEVYATYTYNF